jgi:hypothetical protein
MQHATWPGWRDIIVKKIDETSHFFPRSDDDGSDPPLKGEGPRPIVYMQKVLMHGDHAS